MAAVRDLEDPNNNGFSINEAQPLLDSESIQPNDLEVGGGQAPARQGSKEQGLRDWVLWAAPFVLIAIMVPAIYFNWRDTANGCHEYNLVG